MLQPQQRVVSPGDISHLWLEPPAIATASLIAVTVTGAAEAPARAALTACG